MTSWGGDGGFGGGGATQYAGGGFMASPAPADGAGTGRKPGEQQAVTLRALTVKQIVDAARNHTGNDEEILVDGQPLHNVTLVGKLTSRSDQETMVVFKLDDGTGTTDVTIWQETDDLEMEEQRRQELQPGRYVRVHGHVRSFGDQRRVTGFNLRPIVDFNEVTYHFIRCLHEHVHLTQSASAPKAEPGTAAQGYGAGGGSGCVGAPPQQNGGGGHKNPVQAAILEAMNSPALCNNDATLDTITNMLSGRFTATQIRLAMGALVDDGHLYTTCDEFHFRACG